MDARYRIENPDEVFSPGLVVFRELVEQNLQQMIAIAKDPKRLRPHCKTHKMQAIIERQLECGIVKHKCATIAEAEMLARAGATDVFLAYNLVGPNIARAVRFVETFPNVTFSVTADHPEPLEQLGAAMRRAGCRIGVMLDINSGQNRTGLRVGPEARQLYRQIAETEGLIPAGLHIYRSEDVV